jgi:hypothetical protein
MEALFSASVALDKDSASDQEMSDQEKINPDDVAEVLFFAGIQNL